MIFVSGKWSSGLLAEFLFATTVVKAARVPFLVASDTYNTARVQSVAIDLLAHFYSGNVGLPGGAT
jgi:hypothetical protein